MSKKAALELTTTVLVTMIVSIIMITLGLLLVFGIIGSGEDEIDKTLRMTQDELEKTLATDKKFFIYNSHQEGDPGKNNIFGIGIINRGNTDDFQLRFKHTFYDKDDQEQTSNLIVAPSKAVGILEKNNGKTLLLEVDIPETSPKGKYFVTVYACSKETGEGPNNADCQQPHDYKYAVGQAVITV